MPEQSAFVSHRRGFIQALIAGATTTGAAVSTKAASAKTGTSTLSPAIHSTSPTLNSTLKRQAAANYRRSMEHFGGQLANPPEQLFSTSLEDPDNQFDVLIIGSGYGASICATRLCKRRKPGVRIAMIERGREWVPGEFRDQFVSVNQQNRNQLFGQHKRSVVNPLGLHNVIMNDEINVWTGNGLGGGSLINANVAVKPDPEVFSKFKWPKSWSTRESFEKYFSRAALGLNLTRLPVDLTPKSKSRRQACESLAERVNAFQSPELSLTFDDRYLDQQGRNPQGVIQRPCTLCGDCITGCNVGAKNTLATNYLPVAKSFGLEIYTQMEVLSIQKCKKRGYRVNLVYFDDTDCGMTRRYTSVYCRMLILGAGSPGSTELLLKSQSREFCFSPALGHRWSGNGDTIGFVVDMDHCNPIGGSGAYRTDARIGPTIETTLHYDRGRKLEDRIIIQDAAIPKGVSKLFKFLLNDRELDNSATMLGMGHDGAVGRVVIENGVAAIRWPGLKSSQYRKMIWKEFDLLARAEGGKYKRVQAFGDNMVTVHPLGGCSASDDPVEGVVNDLGQVYDCHQNGAFHSASSMTEIHKGLYVADGSVVPSSLGVNPFLTICAISERIAEGILSAPEHAEIFRAA